MPGNVADFQDLGHFPGGFRRAAFLSRCPDEATAAHVLAAAGSHP
ncbi:MAG: hypothetical protein ACT4O1_18120 [Gemmatimonadota bacterium]